MNTKMRNLIIILLIIGLTGLSPQAVGATQNEIHSSAASPTELFFTEYVEGSSNNKALEIFNGTGAAVDLAAGGYNVQMFFNGNTSAGLTINLTGTVSHGDVFILAHSSAVADILNVADQTNGAGWFNGDDAVVFRKGTTIIDAIGQVGFDPGSEWGTGLTSTGDNTLRRKANICQGDTNSTDPFDPALEWDGFASNTFAGLGAHTAECNGGITDPLLNEFVLNHIGTDTHEYVEIFGQADANYSAFTILQIEGDGAGAGVIDSLHTIGTTNADGFWTTGFLNNIFENGTVTLLLVEGFTGTVGQDLDTNNDGVLESVPWTRLVDDVAVSDGGAGDVVYATTVLAPGFGGSSFPPGGASRIPNGTDSNSTSDWTLNDFDGAGLPGFTGSPAQGEALNTPGAVNELVTPPPEICGDAFTPIYTVQGSGSASSLDGSEVAVEGIVVGDFQNNGQADNGELNGFHLQDPTGDGDPATSDGIFVFAPGSPDVSLGDRVRVRGIVDEFFNLTEITNVSLTLVCSAGNTVAPTEISLPVAAVSDFEPYEGMLVTFPQTLYISEYFNFDRFGEIVLTTERQFQPTAVYEPSSSEAAQLAQENLLGRITLDDGRSSQNPDPAIHPNGSVFDLTNRFRGGDSVENVTGVMDFSFSLYRIQPTQGADYTAQNPMPGGHEDVGGSLKVASFNVLNYFTTIDNGSFICGPALNQECRGADTLEEFQRQRAKIIAALSAIQADIVGLIEMENTTGVEPMEDIVAGLNAQLGPGTYAYVVTGTIGGDAIKVGIIYKPATVTPIGDYAILDSTVDPRFVDTLNRPVLAQTFMENATGGVLTVAVNHLKSKGSACGPGDDDPQQGNCNETRKRAAQAMVDWLASDPTGSGDADFLITGDLNAYDKEEPIDILLAGADDTFGTGDDYTDLIQQYQGEFAYSYVFDGQLGYLDHALANQNLSAQVTGATIWHINADEPDILDYDTTFKQPAQDALFEPNAFRSSDHDPVIVGFNLNGSPRCSDAAPSLASLWPVNHMFVNIGILGITDPEGDPITITIDSIFQDEAVNAPDSGNTAPDGRGLGTSTAEVRAERVGTGNGRAYHIFFTARDSQGGSCSGVVQVGVPISKNGNPAIDDGPVFDSTIVP